MAKELAAQNTYNEDVISAISIVPRHLFVSSGLDNLAYADKPLAIACSQTISQPSTVALQSHLLGEITGKRVLEIGTGCGYQTAILLQMGAEVYSIERQKELCMIANGNLKRTGYNSANLFFGDGHNGLPQFAPFDAIIVTCCAKEIPEKLLSQLKDGGKMVIPVGHINNRQNMLVIERTAEKEYTKRVVGECNFVPMLDGVTK
ncbi:MAG: protein-L-isoaspartate(D-aspartate) O-methyltransferase [Bacteroidales bacterium]|nr:protein-L-isoaspartate(D-aspartate) O-methyltransferase [Bacteroidales bacterium]